MTVFTTSSSCSTADYNALQLLMQHASMVAQISTVRQTVQFTN